MLVALTLRSPSASMRRISNSLTIPSRSVSLHLHFSCAQIKMSGWVFHSARINSLAWSPSGKYIVSGGLDQHIFIWSLENRMKRISVKSMSCVCVCVV